MDSAQGDCYAVAFSPDGRELVAGINDHSAHGSIRVYDTSDFSEIRELVAGHNVPVKHLAFSRDGQHLASAGENGNIFLWQWPQRRRLGIVPPACGNRGSSRSLSRRRCGSSRRRIWPCWPRLR